MIIEFNAILRTLSNRRNFNKDLQTKERHIPESIKYQVLVLYSI